MTVIYNSHPFDCNRFGGVSQYYAQLWKWLPSSVKKVICIREADNVHLEECGFKFSPPSCTFRDFLPWFNFRGKMRIYKLLIRIFRFVYPSMEMRNESCFQEKLREGDFDILHLTGIHGHVGLFKKLRNKKPIVVMCPDLIPEIFRPNPAYHKENQEAFRSSTRIITISNCTKNDIVRLYGISPEKIDVVYLGTSCHDKMAIRKSNTVGRYILYVGKRGGYKNFAFFVKAVSEILREDRDLKIFCTGSPFTEEEDALLQMLGIRDQVSVAFVADEDMSSIYHNAWAFVYPSLYEGFGIPVLDAFASGCPTLLARASCFPEVAQNAAMYFDPCDDGSELRKCLQRLKDEEGLRQKLVDAGLGRASEFSWEKCARETALVYERVIQDWKAAF